MKIAKENRVGFLTALLTLTFQIQKYLMPTFEINKPDVGSCIYALWHGQQCGLYGLSDRTKNNVMVSRSVDGEIVAKAIESLGMKTVRGSKGKKGAVEGSMQMISKLKEGENGAITVDGPRGPKGIAKDGIIKIAKLSGRPIVPFVWYSPDITYIKLPTWDDFRYPLGCARMINLFGEPIYVDKNNTEEDDEKIRLQIENTLKDLDEKAPKYWKKAWKWKLWIFKNEKINL